MRVIAGTYRSRPLAAPRGLDTRPTSDRLRETLFNILSPRLEGCCFVDLYAGTGAVGIEALSRGAAHVWFAENADPALASLRANLTALKISSGFTVEPRGVGAVLQKLGKLTQQIDLVFLDPPYEAEAEYSGTLSFLGSARGREMLAPDALVIVEHTKKAKLAARYGALEHTRLVKQGDATLSFFAFAAAKENPHPDAAL
ncbi:MULTISPECIES: 16S rRNA (guanine(966)-N(2))-methyltransferase RsmD [Acidobacteriaceae]|uniref:16S rRNA (guanine(966)-N(2))-methyltransferase RsmD n=1 Tax=Acidobacteriaceae TaxID=204434 RepID=UPI00131DDCA0|nr:MULTISPECIES: 16S rRNA (guanine(966)-N(2))-methyltransferase RsmD [Acidobacteriaceae]MDW5267744.1 16S rRNA (guanine(966)-N(2))-methyltransferase RsmD [Edaphobacter sp.]